MIIESISVVTMIGICLICMFLVVAIAYIIWQGKATLYDQIVKTLDDQKVILNQELDQEKALLKNANSEISELRIQISSKERDLLNLQEKYHEIINDGHGMQQKFEALANKILDSKAEKFDREQKRSLETTLNPLKEKIKSFEEKVENNIKESIARHSSLKTEIISLKELNERITNETTNLTRALKGDSKTQGNWGELILESILEKSGLEKGREYFIQSSFINEEGSRQRPDVIIHLPQNKKIIIDSKASITAYEKLINAVNADDQVNMLKAHGISIKNHIDQLAAKNYYDIYKMESPDFVLMFLPMDTAFSAALRNNPNLYSYAFDKNIVVVTPATLLATLKTIDTLWKNEKQQLHAIEIADEAGKMYDKFAGLIDDLIQLGKKIDQTKDHYQDSMKKLHTGRGDLITRAEKLKKLGVKVKKELPQTLIDRAMDK
ncbi:MAG: DNA recombination protein RmuC [Saprospiraceae bacterium]|nr:DNA recombination protein RmuC [Saprospiraceae bacterium]